MRNILFSLLTVVIVTAFTGSGCKKDSSSSPFEEDLKISIDAGSYTVTPGPDFDFNLNIESAMPSAGVRIEFTVKGEVDGQNYPQGPAIQTKDKSIRIKINNLPRQKICICEITVTSNTKKTNIAKTSFRVGYK